MVPAVGVESLANKRATVVLPLPLSPTKAVARHGCRASEASSTACTIRGGPKSLTLCKGNSLRRCDACRMGSSLVDVSVLVGIFRLQSLGWTFRVQFGIIQVASNVGYLSPSRRGIHRRHSSMHLSPFTCHMKQRWLDGMTGCERKRTAGR